MWKRNFLLKDCALVTQRDWRGIVALAVCFLLSFVQDDFFFTYFCAQSPFVVLKNCIKISAHLDKQVDFISLFAKLLFVVRWHAAGQVCGKLQISFHFTADVPAMFLLCFLKRKELHDHCVLCLCWGKSQSLSARCGRIASRRRCLLRWIYISI